MNTIFLIEDDETIAELTQEYLEGQDFNVRIYSNGERALSDLQAGLRPSVILLDSQLPVMTGAQFMARFHKMAGDIRAIPVLLFSAGPVETEYKAIGCTGYLKKPMDLRALSAAVAPYKKPG